MIRRMVITSAIAAAALLTVLPGCEKELFPKQGPRTQFDRYDALRGRPRAATRLNEFGGDEPAVTERLRPLETP